MLSNLNFWEIIGLALLGLFIFGPERLPKVIGDAGRMIRNLRNMARNATNDLSRELGTDVSLEDLHPKTFIRKHLLSEEDEQALRRPLEDAYRDVRRPVDEAYQDVKSVATDANDYTLGSQPGLPAGPYDPVNDGQSQPALPEPRRFDADAT